MAMKILFQPGRTGSLRQTAGFRKPVPRIPIRRRPARSGNIRQSPYNTAQQLFPLFKRLPHFCGSRRRSFTIKGD
jgi:hypothetical protein